MRERGKGSVCARERDGGRESKRERDREGEIVR